MLIKLDAMQSEIADLIKKIDGVQDASVMITMPEQGLLLVIRIKMRPPPLC